MLDKTIQNKDNKKIDKILKTIENFAVDLIESVDKIEITPYPEDFNNPEIQILIERVRSFEDHFKMFPEREDDEIERWYNDAKEILNRIMNIVENIENDEIIIDHSRLIKGIDKTYIMKEF